MDPVGPVAPVAPVELRVIVSVAGWLVVVLSLLSNAAFILPSFGVTMNPLLVVAVSQLLTAVVAST